MVLFDRSIDLGIIYMILQAHAWGEKSSTADDRHSAQAAGRVPRDVEDLLEGSSPPVFLPCSKLAG